MPDDIPTPAEDNNVVSFRAAAPSARLKDLDWTDKRAQCKHKNVEIWAKEPIIECSECGAVVDPYDWIRDRVKDWRHWHHAEFIKYKELKREREELQKQVRILRGEYRDEAERVAAERNAARAIAVMPPRKVR